MMISGLLRRSPLCLFLAAFLLLNAAAAADVHVRFKMVEPGESVFYVRLGGYIHRTPWYLPKAVWPVEAAKNQAKRVKAGTFTPWFNFSKHAGKAFHGRMNRAGGIAEFPNVTVDFIAEPDAEKRVVIIEIATKPSDDAVVKRFKESYTGHLTSFLISPDPKRDADELETASEMSERRLSWAREATKGKRSSPKNLIIQTSFWGPQRRELNLKEAEVLWLLGFNTVGNQMKEVREEFELRVPGHTHGINIGPGATQEQIDALMAKHAAGNKEQFGKGVPFNFGDELVCRPRIGDNEQALAHFHEWLAKKKIAPKTLGVGALTKVVPIETPEVLRQRQKENDATARRVFYYTSRFRQESGTERLRWHTEAFHKHFQDGPVTSTLVADHPYFAGTGLGLGMIPNSAWGGAPLALDWFDLARTKALDLIGIEDWMGLQFMYGPYYTWEGFQLMGFQASIFRSGSRGTLPIITWITPSDETNLRLKSASALCQGSKHFFYWTYGPTITSTENYWSDLRSAYDGVAKISRQLAAAEHIIAPGKTRKTRLALLYSISSDLWQPFGYVHMLERRVTYLCLIHNQHLVDMITEEDVESGRLKDYDVLYVTDPCIKQASARLISEWVTKGGYVYGSCAAGSLNEFGEPSDGLAGVFGIRKGVTTEVQPGNYRTRAALNGLRNLDLVKVEAKGVISFGAIGTKSSIAPHKGKVIGRFEDGAPAVVTNRYGKGTAVYTATCPAISYAKDAKFVLRELKEQWPAVQRAFINSLAKQHVPRLVELSHPVVETGIYDSDAGTALALANFTYKPITGLRVKIALPKRCKIVRSVEKGALKFTISSTSTSGPEYSYIAKFALDLGLNDIVILE